jgi:hypothetical protein
MCFVCFCSCWQICIMKFCVDNVLFQYKHLTWGTYLFVGVQGRLGDKTMDISSVLNQPTRTRLKNMTNRAKSGCTYYLVEFL